MMNFTADECNLMMLYSPGTRSGLIKELNRMKNQLTPSEKRLKKLAESTLSKLEVLSDEEFEQLNLYPDF